MAQRKSAAPQVGVVMGSDSDWETLRHAAAQLDAFGVPYEARVVSAHRMPASRAARATGAKRSIDSAIEQLMFFCENASLAAAKTTTSSASPASAPSNPFMFGTSTE